MVPSHKAEIHLHPEMHRSSLYVTSFGHWSQPTASWLPIVEHNLDFYALLQWLQWCELINMIYNWQRWWSWSPHKEASHLNVQTRVHLRSETFEQGGSICAIYLVRRRLRGIQLHKPLQLMTKPENGDQQSELFFCLLLKDTMPWVRPPAYSSFRSPFEGPKEGMQELRLCISEQSRIHLITGGHIKS